MSQATLYSEKDPIGHEEVDERHKGHVGQKQREFTLVTNVLLVLRDDTVVLVVTVQSCMLPGAGGEFSSAALLDQS